MKTSISRSLITILGCLALASCNSIKQGDETFDSRSSTLKIEHTIDSLLKAMTLDEKISMIHASSSFTSGGIPRLGIPELVMSDGPHGVRKEHGRDWEIDLDADDSATYLPTGIGLAATWNPELGHAYGKVLGAEANFRGKDVILGPGVNIIRTPLNGRNFEYLSEDPYLTSRMAVGYIKGVQEQGVSACVKHYLANNQEHDRKKINVEMSERALREIYLPAFAAAVKEADVNTVMGAYNKFRGQHCTHHEYLINEVLKKELGFNGVVISDWSAVTSTMEAIRNGCDIEMGSEFTFSTAEDPDYTRFFMGDTIIDLVKEGTISESLIDDKVRRILRIMLKTKMIGAEKRQAGAFNTPEHQAVALKVAEESITLLKNDDNLLPLHSEKIKNLVVIGANAERKHAGAGGSSQVNAKYEITPLEGIRRRLDSTTNIRFVPGYTIERNAKADPVAIEKAVAATKGADAVIYVGGWIHGYSDEWNDNVYDAESLDKPDMQLPFGQNELLKALVKAYPGLVTVFIGGGPFDMSGFEPQTKAIVQAWYPGMEGGNALAGILFGDINPSGKLPISFPKKLEDVPAHKIGEYPGDGRTVYYKDDIYVGYRYYETKKVAPLFPFGHGLSYTTFAYEDLKLEKDGNKVIVKFSIINTGKIPGAETAQIYVTADSLSVGRPEKELKGFQKVYLEPGNKKAVSLILQEDAFKYYDEQKKKWVLEPGRYIIKVGGSSKNIRQSGKVSF